MEHGELPPLVSVSCKDLQFVGEGNEHIVLSIGKFGPRVLRLRKSKSGEMPSRDDFLLRAKLDVYFINVISRALLGPFLVDEAQMVSVDPEALEIAMKRISPLRKVSRLNKKINPYGIGVIFPNATTTFRTKNEKASIELDGGRTKMGQVSCNGGNDQEKPLICVELKPKQGFVEVAQSGISICRFCAKQITKIRKGVESSMSNYCPLNLFSGIEPLMKIALSGLFKTPQNNLKIFVDGVQDSQVDRYSYLSPVILLALLHQFSDSSSRSLSNQISCSIAQNSGEDFRIEETPCSEFASSKRKYSSECQNMKIDYEESGIFNLKETPKDAFSGCVNMSEGTNGKSKSEVIEAAKDFRLLESPGKSFRGKEAEEDDGILYSDCDNSYDFDDDRKLSNENNRGQSTRDDSPLQNCVFRHLNLGASNNLSPKSVLGRLKELQNFCLGEIKSAALYRELIARFTNAQQAEKHLQYFQQSFLKDNLRFKSFRHENLNACFESHVNSSKFLMLEKYLRSNFEREDRNRSELPVRDFDECTLSSNGTSVNVFEADNIAEKSPTKCRTSSSDLSILPTDLIVHLLRQSLISMSVKDASLMILLEGPLVQSEFCERSENESCFWIPIHNQDSEGEDLAYGYKAQVTIVDISLKCGHRLLAHEETLREMENSLQKPS